MARAVPRKLGRRQVLGAAAGGLAAAAIHAVARPDTADAATGEFLKLGYGNTAEHTTVLDRTAESTHLEFVNTHTALIARHYGSVNGIAIDANVTGSSATSVYATAPGTSGTAISGSVSGNSGTALMGKTSGHNSQIAVLAEGNAGLGEGYAVKALTRNGIALYGEAQSPGGYGLQVVGRAVFHRSGKINIAGGQSSKTLAGWALTAATLIIATVQGNTSNVWVKNVQIDHVNDRFAVNLNAPAPANGVVVGFFIVN